jgi:Trk K+ transport system NAD-binding subunit/Kef-type K+ transport system membrane component KefB
MISVIRDMEFWVQVLVYLGTFSLVALASGRIAGIFEKLKLPQITGFLLIGLVSGPELLGVIDADALPRLNFLNEIALAFIAFAVGSELFIKDLRRRMKSILFMLVSQTVILFLLVGLVTYFILDLIPFFEEQTIAFRIAVSLLVGTIAIATSPAASIAVINELRARGPFTQTSIGVTVVKDFVVIVLFSLVFTLAKSFIYEVELSLQFIGQVLAELFIAFGLGFILWLTMRLIFQIKGALRLKKLLVLGAGYLAYLLSGLVRAHSGQYLGMTLHVEPLLICIVGSFLVINYSIYRNDFTKIVKETGPYVYIVFFTLTGARISLDVVSSLWYITIMLFGVRVLSLVIAGVTGSMIAGDPPKLVRLSWMPYVTQAGISLGLATVIGSEFSGWGENITTLLISVIVLNEIIGPPLFKWALHLTGEAHIKPDGTYEVERKIIIFGWENQSVALARQLMKQNWSVEFVVPSPSEDVLGNDEFEVHEFQGPDHLALRKFSAETADTLLCLLSDDENYGICETAYEHFGTKHLIVRLTDRTQYRRFHKLDVMVIDPTTAMVSLMEHFVRAPIATSLLLGMDESQDSIDIELRNSNYHGLTLRDLRLPSDVIILSVTRGDHPIISHGYTRLRLGDIVTVVGSNQSLEKVRLNLQGY